MPLIEVNHQLLREVAEAGKRYCEEQEKEMKTAKERVESLYYTWRSADAAVFRSKWDDVDGEGSAAKGVKDSIKGFSDALNASAEEYRKAQEDSYNEAYHLTHWW
ncbi:MAG: hypothetical protein ACI4J4_00240 [Ruminiclostridium sp.]